MTRKTINHSNKFKDDKTKRFSDHTIIVLNFVSQIFEFSKNSKNVYLVFFFK